MIDPEAFEKSLREDAARQAEIARDWSVVDGDGLEPEQPFALVAQAPSIALPEIARTGAALNRHNSVQVVGTPWTFIRAVEKRFGPLAWDLAATKENAKAPRYLSLEEGNDSFRTDWTRLDGNLFINPTFDSLGKWMERCRRSCEVPHAFDRILALVPASVGSKWYAEHVNRRAFTIALTGRMVFESHSDPYPKDLLLIEWGGFAGFDCWSWEDDVPGGVAMSEPVRQIRLFDR